MKEGFDFFSIYIANGIGLLIGAILLIGNKWSLRSGKEGRYIRYLLYAAMLCCIVDPFVFKYDGLPGLWNHIFIYLGNLFIFASNLFIGPLWIIIVVMHMKGEFSKPLLYMIYSYFVLGVLMLIVNFFTSIIFGVNENNVYFRGPLFWILAIVEVIFVVVAIYLYFRYRERKNGSKFFQIWLYFIPILICNLYQAFNYGVSTVNAAMVIGVSGLIVGIQNEAVYQDQLTGLFNRFYLETMLSNNKINNYRNCTAMMVDMNNFKKINDTFGHYEGDKALIRVGKVLHDTVNDLGFVIRYAGDEFFVLLNTNQQESINNCVDALFHNLKEENKKDTRYELSFSIGISIVNEEITTLNQLLNKVDSKMYQAKKEYYQSHPHVERRNRR